MEIKCWTPLYSLKPINLDEFGNNPGYHPLIIFKNNDEEYFYLTCTSKIKKKKIFMF